MSPQIGDSQPGELGSFKPRDCYTAEGGRKLIYPTRKAAKIGMRLRAKAVEAGTGDLTVYRCRHCRKYHVGHKRQQ